MNVGRKKLRVCYYCYYWASEVSPTLMSTIEIEIYIYIYKTKMRGTLLRTSATYCVGIMEHMLWYHVVKLIT